MALPNLGAFHPIVVHFAIALVFVGVGFRLLTLLGMKWANLPAFLLIGGATLASFGAVRSGVDAHGPVERIPGARAAVVEHEELGEKARNIFAGVLGIEVLALLLSRAAGAQKGAWGLSALVGLVGCFYMYETGEHGGELVYKYAGGPGLRHNDSADVRRLLTAGLYNQSVNDRKQGNGAGANQLIELLRQRNPQDAGIALLAVESMIRDLKDPSRALRALDSVAVPENDQQLASRAGTLRVDAYLAAQQPDSAKAVLTSMIQKFETNPRLVTRLKARLDSLASK